MCGLHLMVQGDTILAMLFAVETTCSPCNLYSCNCGELCDSVPRRKRPV